jgi:DNA-binding NarL/FixJ family response regulator
MPIRTVIIEAHPLTRCGIRELAARHQDIEIVGETDSVAGARRLVPALRPDVVTIDVTLADGDGLLLARELRDGHPGLGIVVLTSLGEDDVLFRALDTGVSAFVTKTAPVEEVLGAVRHAAVAATSFTASGLLAALARRERADSRFALSPRERQVLELLRDGSSVAVIARSLFVSQSTAKTYVARLYDKLGANCRAQALMTALRHGLIRLDGTPGVPVHATA